ncbi:ABC-three component system middle component 6 [Parafannyhessea sp. LCP21S3_E6]|uniref:ABC-three component system middle component 6 n=2 Tax=unclassified Parafannyhessea TaxID=2847323 RepID=UPI003F9C5932
MIMPTKGISPERCLLGIGADVLDFLSTSMSVSEIWAKYKKRRNQTGSVSFDWFVLALDLLYCVGAISLSPEGRLVRNDVS